MSNGLVRYVMEAVGGSQVRQALRGVVGESRAADRAVLASSRATGAARNRLARQEGDGARAAARIRVRAETEADRAILASARARSREERRLVQAEERDMRRAMRDGRGRGPGGSGGGARAAMGAVAGIADAITQAITGTIDRYSGAGGVRSREQLIAERAERRQRLIRLNRQMERPAGTFGEIDAQIQQTAGRTGVSQEDLLAGLETAQARFTSAPSVLANLEQYARVTQASGARFEDVVGAMGNAQIAYSLTTDQMSEALGLLVDAGNRGSIDAGELASAFGPALGELERGTQMGGIEGLRQTLGVAEVLGRGGQTPAESGTMAPRFVAALNERDTQRALRRAGVNVMGENGQMRPIEDIVADMADSRLATSPGLMQDIFKNVVARNAAGILMHEYAANPEQTTQLFHSDAGAGNRWVADTAAEMDADLSAPFLRQGIAQENALVAGGQEAEVMGTMGSLGTEMATLTSQYPLATEALVTMRDAVMGVSSVLGSLGLAAMGAKALGLGGASAAGGGVAAVAGGGVLGSVVTGLATVAAPAALATFGFRAAAGGTREMTAAEQEAANARRQRITAEALGLLRDPESLGLDATQVQERAQLRSRAVQAASHGQTVDRAFLESLVRQGRGGEVRLADESVAAIGRVIDRGAPAAGRQPGETGRRR